MSTGESVTSLLASPVRVAPVKNRIDLDDPLVGPCEEHAPSTNPETETTSWLAFYRFDVAGAGCGVPLDVMNDAVTFPQVQFLEVTT